MLDLLDDEAFHVLLLLCYVIPAGILYLYGTARILNLLRAIVGTRFFTDDPQQRAGVIGKGHEPHVTIQICTYNEGDVVEETIKHACQLDWPKDKLHIQVNDDSTDRRSQEFIKRAVQHWSKVAHVVRRVRPDRRGYKAGSLSFHSKAIQGDFVTILDADHRLQPDFLRKTMPHFYDKRGRPKNHVALVQTPWAFYNIHQNYLTESGKCVLTVLLGGRRISLTSFSFL